MRRLLRHAFTICSAISLVLCFAVCVLWVRSYFHHDFVEIDVGGRVVRAQSVVGALDLWWGPDGWEDAKGVISRRMPVAPLRSEWLRALGVFYFYREPMRPQRANVRLGLPHWFVVGTSAILPTGVFVRARRRRRRGTMNLCSACGYDLRASPERCPECGTAVSPDV